MRRCRSNWDWWQGPITQESMTKATATAGAGAGVEVVMAKVTQTKLTDPRKIRKDATGARTAIAKGGTAAMVGIRVVVATQVIAIAMAMVPQEKASSRKGTVS